MSSEYSAAKTGQQSPAATCPGRDQAYSSEANLAEIACSSRASTRRWRIHRRAFMTAPSPGMLASAMHNRYHGDENAYLDALADALVIEYRAAVEKRPDLAIDARIWRWSGISSW